MGTAMASGTSAEPRQATREEMRDARLPLAYRDSCGHLLIPLNKCRRETFYAPWKCSDEPQLREVPVRRVQEARGQDGRAEGGQGWSEEQLDDWFREGCVYVRDKDGPSLRKDGEMNRVFAEVKKK